MILLGLCRGCTIEVVYTKAFRITGVVFHLFVMALKKLLGFLKVRMRLYNGLGLTVQDLGVWLWGLRLGVWRVRRRGLRV